MDKSVERQKSIAIVNSYSKIDLDTNVDNLVRQSDIVIPQSIKKKKPKLSQSNAHVQKPSIDLKEILRAASDHSKPDEESTMYINYGGNRSEQMTATMTTDPFKEAFLKKQR